MREHPKSRSELNADELGNPDGEPLPKRRAMSVLHTDAAAGLTVVTDDSTAVIDAQQGGSDDEAA